LQCGALSSPELGLARGAKNLSDGTSLGLLDPVVEIFKDPIQLSPKAFPTLLFSSSHETDKEHRLYRNVRGAGESDFSGRGFPDRTNVACTGPDAFFQDARDASSPEPDFFSLLFFRAFLEVDFTLKERSTTDDAALPSTTKASPA